MAYDGVLQLLGEDLPLADLSGPGASQQQQVVTGRVQLHFEVGQIVLLVAQGVIDLNNAMRRVTTQPLTHLKIEGKKATHTFLCMDWVSSAAFVLVACLRFKLRSSVCTREKIITPLSHWVRILA